MFGHIQINASDLSEAEKKRYRAAYCGLCHTLGKRHGFLARFSLTYDLTFLALLLSSLYEPDETCSSCRCVARPCKKHGYVINRYTEYAADMTIAFMYYKCLDDWEDDRSIPGWLVARFLRKKYEKVKTVWGPQCAVIETELSTLSHIEKAKVSSPDAAANSFGRLMAGIFAVHNDNWENALRQFGFGLGRYIYLADAALDYKKGIRRGSYNPLAELGTKPDEMRSTLKMVLGEASEAFEFLPLVQDIHLLKNILYSGIWIKYNRGTRKKRDKNG